MRRMVSILVLAASLGAASCGKKEAEPPPPSSPPPSSPSDEGAPDSSLLPIPGGEEKSGELPPGHPPVGQTAGNAVPGPPPGSGEGETGVRWKAPAGWIAETPSSPMRKAQYRVPGPGGDGECAVFYFGPGQGGDPMANAQRWVGQFKK